MKGTMRGICKMEPGVGAEYRTDLPIPEISDDEINSCYGNLRDGFTHL